MFRLDYIKRHQKKSAGHAKAVAWWNHEGRLRGMGAEGAAGAVCQAAAAGVAVSTPDVRGSADFYFLRVLLETHGSFNDYAAWTKAAAAVSAAGGPQTPRHCWGAKRSLETMAAAEQ